MNTPKADFLAFSQDMKQEVRRNRDCSLKCVNGQQLEKKKNYFCLHWLPQEYQKTSSYHISTRNGNKSMSSRKTLSL